MTPSAMKLSVLLLSAAVCHGFRLTKPVVLRLTQSKDTTFPKIRSASTTLAMNGAVPLTAARWRIPSAKVQIALAAHVVVIAVALSILRFLVGHLIKLIQGLVKTKKNPKDRVTLEVEYARRKKDEQEKARLAAWKKGQEREAADLRAQKRQQQHKQQKFVIPEIPKPNVVDKPKPTVKIVQVEVPKRTAVPVPTDGINAAKKRELAAIEQRKRHQAMMLARPMDGLNAAKQQELAVIAQRKLQQDMMARDHLSSTREEEAEKNRKLTSMMATAERDAKRLTESALANVKAKVADVVEQRLESEEKEEELRYAQEWAAAVSSKKKESSGQVKSSIYSALRAVVDRSRQFWLSPVVGPSEEEALAMYQNKVKAQQQAAAQKNARRKGQALEGAEIMAMKSKMSHEEAEAKARLEEEEHRQALDRAFRRKEAEEAAAAISYAKTVKRVEDAKRARAINKGKVLEQAGEYVRQPAPSALAAVPATSNIATVLKNVVGLGQRLFGMEGPSEEVALAMYQNKIKTQQQDAAQKNARSKGQALEGAEIMAMKSKMSHEEAEAKARMEEEEDRQARATALRRKEAEEAAAAISYAKSMKRLDDAKRARAINRLKAQEQIEREAFSIRPQTSSVNTVAHSVTPSAATASMVGRSSTRGENKVVSEQDALAMYAMKVKADQAAKQQKLKQNKLLTQASDSSSQGQQVLQSIMPTEEKRASEEEEEDRRALAAALRRKQAEETAAMVAYQKTIQKLNLVRAGNQPQSSSLSTSSVSGVSEVNTWHGIAGSTYQWTPHSMIRGGEAKE